MRRSVLHYVYYLYNVITLHYLETIDVHRRSSNIPVYKLDAQSQRTQHATSFLWIVFLKPAQAGIFSSGTVKTVTDKTRVSPTRQLPPLIMCSWL